MLEKIRKAYVDELDKSSMPEIKKLANYIGSKDKQGRKPCWGKIVSKVNKLFSNDELKIILWKELVRISEENALMLFILEHKENENILNEMLIDFDFLPTVVQKLFISIDETENKVDEYMSKLSKEVQIYYNQDQQQKEAEVNALKQKLEMIKGVDLCLGHPTNSDHEH